MVRLTHNPLFPRPRSAPTAGVFPSNLFNSLDQLGFALTSGRDMIGRWLRDVQSSISTPHTYIGTDIVQELFPSDLPPSITLTMQSITQPWPHEWPHSFDLAHQRFALAGAGTNPIKDVVMNPIELVKAGGWIQLVEVDFNAPPTNGGEATENVFRLVREIMEMVGPDTITRGGFEAGLRRPVLRRSRSECLMFCLERPIRSLRWRQKGSRVCV